MCFDVVVVVVVVVAAADAFSFGVVCLFVFCCYYC
jgi:hypothetical protein